MDAVFQASVLTFQLKRRLAELHPSVVRSHANEMRGLGSAVDEKTTDDLFLRPVGLGDAFVRAQMLEPRVRQECFDETTILSGIFEKSPVVGTVTAALVRITS